MAKPKKVQDVLYHIDFYGNVKPLSDKAYWEIDYVKGSTNRLIVDAPLSDSFGISTEQEIIFKGRRFIITELQRERNSSTISITADEAQIELASKVIRKFTLKENTLAQSITKAVAGSKWTVGTTFTGDKKYFAEIENKSAMYCLTFLARQSGGQLVFDSVNRVVSIVKDEEIIADVTYRYKNNMNNIIKKETQPEATILYPYGRDGMTIEALNNGKKYIEDFTWYTNLGLDIKEARARFSKEQVWEDGRYIYNANLFEDAKKKLSLLAYPTISYELDVAQVPDNLDVNSHVYVVDEELGIKIKTAVVRIKITKGGQNNSLELSYVPPSLGAVFEDEFTGDSSNSASETAFFQVKNQSDINLSTAFSQVIISTVTVFSATAFEIGFTCQVESTAGGLLEGYWTLDGETIYSFKQTVATGWHTLGVPFIITAIPEGTKTLVLNMKTSGTAKISKEKAEMYVKAQGVYGGASNERPDQTISETVEFSVVEFGLSESVGVLFEPQNNTDIVEQIVFNQQTFGVTEIMPVITFTNI